MNKNARNFLWDTYFVLARQAYQAPRGGGSVQPLTYAQSSVSENIQSQFAQIWSQTPYLSYNYDEYDSRYIRSQYDHDSVTYEKYIRHLQFTPQIKSLLSALTEELRPFITEHLGHHFCVVKTRVFDCFPGMDDNYFKWHSDHFPIAIKKVMIYLTPPGDEYGTTLIKHGEQVVKVVGPAGTALIFNNNLEHRAVGPADNHPPRRAIELTVAAALFPDPVIQYPGLSANWPMVPFDLQNYISLFNERGLELVIENKSELECNKLFRQIFQQRQQDLDTPIKGLNIGGGPNFYQTGWANLDGAYGLNNYVPFRFTPRAVFPFEDGSLERIYTSHTFEHLDEPTLSRVLTESHRILCNGGELLIKIPDYDLFMELYQQGDVERMVALSRIEKIEKYILQAGIELNAETVLSFIICNFWNSAYGKDHYEVNTVRDEENAYFGPARIHDANQLREIFACKSPRTISEQLRSFVVSTEEDLIWGHQIAFSTDELSDYLEGHGFKVLSSDKHHLLERCSDWPEIKWLADRSMFMLVRREG